MLRASSRKHCNWSRLTTARPSDSQKPTRTQPARESRSCLYNRPLLSVPITGAAMINSAAFTSAPRTTQRRSRCSASQPKKIRRAFGPTAILPPLCRFRPKDSGIGRGTKAIHCVASNRRRLSQPRRRSVQASSLRRGCGAFSPVLSLLQTDYSGWSRLSVTQNTMAAIELRAPVITKEESSLQRHSSRLRQTMRISSAIWRMLLHDRRYVECSGLSEPFPRHQSHRQELMFDCSECIQPTTSNGARTRVAWQGIGRRLFPISRQQLRRRWTICIQILDTSNSCNPRNISLDLSRRINMGDEPKIDVRNGGIVYLGAAVQMAQQGRGRNCVGSSRRLYGV